MGCLVLNCLTAHRKQFPLPFPIFPFFPNLTVFSLYFHPISQPFILCSVSTTWKHRCVCVCVCVCVVHFSWPTGPLRSVQQPDQSKHTPLEKQLRHTHPNTLFQNTL